MNYSQISLTDKAKYLRGLIIILKIGRKISNPEREYILFEAKNLGYNLTFCNNAMDDVLLNPYIKSSPIVFQQKSICNQFIQTGMALSKLNSAFLLEKENWLQSVLEANKTKKELFNFQHTSLAGKKEFRFTNLLKA